MPLMGVAEQPVVGVGLAGLVGLEVGAAEGLQRMFNRQSGEQRFTAGVLFLAFLLMAGQSPTGGNMVAQLAEQHRGRLGFVVVNAAADPADHQPLTGREQRLKKQVAVVFAARAVAGAVVLAHQVDIQRALGTRIVFVIHAQQADVAERDGAHRHQRGDVDRAGQKTLGKMGLIDLGQPVLAHHRQRQRFNEPGVLGGFLPLLQTLFQACQSGQVGLVIGGEAVAQQFAQPQAPVVHCGWFAQLPPVAVQGVDQVGQRPDQHRFQAADIAVGLDIMPRAGCVLVACSWVLCRLAHRIAQQQAPQAKGPGVGGKAARQIEAGTLFGV